MVSVCGLGRQDECRATELWRNIADEEKSRANGVSERSLVLNDRKSALAKPKVKLWEGECVSDTVVI